MLASFFPVHYRVLYIVPCVFLVTVLYSNTVEIHNLTTQEESAEHRVLLTITATFTYKRQLRWIWLWLALCTSLIYAGVVPRMFKQYFLQDREFTKSVRSFSQRPVPGRWVTILMYSSTLWCLFLCGVVFLIDGTFPARTANIERYVWVIHFTMLGGMLLCVGTNIVIFLKLLHLAEPNYRRFQHDIRRKYLLATCWFGSILGMLTFGGITIFTGALPFDYVCFFEYTTVLFHIIFVIDQWSGMVGSDSLKVLNGYASDHRIGDVVQLLPSRGTESTLIHGIACDNDSDGSMESVSSQANDDIVLIGGRVKPTLHGRIPLTKSFSHALQVPLRASRLLLTRTVSDSCRPVVAENTKKSH